MKTHQERFHALDATRAAALILGIIFHALWSYIPANAGAPIIDSTSNMFATFAFYTSHIFRMHLFFLIAGFFGALIFSRRGSLGFIKHRLLRIGIPLIIFWVLLAPLLDIAWAAGRDISGANPETRSAVSIALDGIKSGAPWMNGSLRHLWFLYYLLLACLFTAGIRPLAIKTVQRFPDFMTGADRIIRLFFTKFWGILVYSIPVAWLLWVEGNTFGTATPQLVIHFSVFGIYLIFFITGWLLYRQSHDIGTLFQGHKWRLSTAILLSFGLFVFFGVSKTPHIKDWPLFKSELAAAKSGNPSNETIQKIAGIIPDKFNDYLADSSEDEENLNIKESINQIIFMSLNYDEIEYVSKGEFQPNLVMYFTKSNQLAEDFPEWFNKTPNPNLPLREQWPSMLYFYAYAICIWLFVTGTLSLFQKSYNHHSPIWRYISDASYWAYILHMPLVPFLQVWTGMWKLSFYLKLPLVLCLGMGICLVTYHYFVRSTWIGVLLNGRKFPFDPNMWSSMNGKSEPTAN